MTLFDNVRATCGDRLTAFELIPRLGLELGIAHVPGVDDPFADRHPHYSLIELTSPREGDDLRGEIEKVLERAWRTKLSPTLSLRRVRLKCNSSGKSAKNCRQRSLGKVAALNTMYRSRFLRQSNSSKKPLTQLSLKFLASAFAHLAILATATSITTLRNLLIWINRHFLITGNA